MQKAPKKDEKTKMVFGSSSLRSVQSRREPRTIPHSFLIIDSGDSLRRKKKQERERERIYKLQVSEWDLEERKGKFHHHQEGYGSPGVF
jgi:hypothetical protein